MVDVYPLEKIRIDEIISSAKRRSWEGFKKLTDVPFINESSMREQFEDSSNRMAVAKGDLDISVVAKEVGDGTRAIFTTIISESDGLNLILTMHNSGNADVPEFAIWNFHQNLDLNSLFD
ncbi:hypothetical protein [Mesorhizobium sp. 1M-11]|uniref:hypothetical protein n=1 Tax=Mesorhizobium sp. 1M-11 TaxID=1529006 RepID=UPI0006C73C2B|nr:hypothetical protein [Mesorhizobium sp. 1M-11]